MVLWPPSAGAPERRRRHVDARVEAGALALRVTGRDPALEWKLDAPVAARAVTLSRDAAVAGPLQLFWSSRGCPHFSEACSRTVVADAGVSAVEFLLDPSDPVRELRLDLPERAGEQLRLRSLVVSTSPERATLPIAREGVELQASPAGLRITARSDDPWITLPTPGLDARHTSAVEVVLRGPAGAAPRVYWALGDGTLSEQAAVDLAGADSGDATHRARLDDRAAWTGPIASLRLDPGTGAGVWTLEALRLLGRAP